MIFGAKNYELYQKDPKKYMDAVAKALFKGKK